jgi:hypothetical protein
LIQRKAARAECRKARPMQHYPSVPRWVVLPCMLVTAAILSQVHAATVDEPPQREVIVIHPRPQTAWDEMMAHKAEYLRLKEKFEPTRRMSLIDLDACERAENLPPGQRPSRIALDMRGCP